MKLKSLKYTMYITNKIFIEQLWTKSYPQTFTSKLRMIFFHIPGIIFMKNFQGALMPEK